MLRRRIRVLVVDDNECIRRTLDKMIRTLLSEVDLAFEIVQAVGGEEAIDMAGSALHSHVDTDPFNLITLDWNMKVNGLNGLQTAQGIRDLYATRSSPKLVILGCSDDFFDRRNEKEVSSIVDQCFYKPIIRSDIKKALKKYLVVEFPPSPPLSPVVCTSLPRVNLGARKYSLAVSMGGTDTREEDDQEEASNGVNTRQKHKSLGSGITVDFSVAAAVVESPTEAHVDQSAADPTGSATTSSAPQTVWTLKRK